MNLAYAYRLFNVNAFSTKKEVRKKYLKMVNIFHPDKLKYTKNNKNLNLDITIEDINEAYNTILDAINQNQKLFCSFGNIHSNVHKINESFDHQELISKFNEDILGEKSYVNNEPKYIVMINKWEAQKGITKKITINNKEKILIKIPPKVIGGQSILMKDKQNNEFIVIVDIK